MSELEEFRRQKNNAYSERDMLLCAFVKLCDALRLTCGLGTHEGQDWDPEWRNVVFVYLPSGQISWHVHDSELEWFSFLERREWKWDGHTTVQKYTRLSLIDALQLVGDVGRNP